MSNSDQEQSDVNDLADSNLVGWAAFFILLSFLGVVTAVLLDSEPLRSANDRSRWCTVYSLVEEGTYEIDKIRRRSGWDTIDLVRHNHHFYSTKPPLLPRIVAEVYRGVKWATGWNLTDDTAAVTRVILFVINLLPMALAMWLMFQLIRRYCTHIFGQLFLIMATCWATLLVPFLTVFNNHTVGTTFIIYSLYLAISIIVEGKSGWWRFALCGACAAFGVCNELPAAAYGLALFFLLLRVNPKQTLLVFVPFALIPIAGFFITNYQATGGWKPFYLYYGTEKYEFVHDGKPSYWLNPQGVDKAKDSFPEYFMHCMVGHHGIFSLTPIYLLSLATWLSGLLMWRSKLRSIHLLGLGLTIIVVGFYMTKTENYNYGGVSVALRWTLWLIPFWILAMIPVLNRCGRSLLTQIPIGVLLCVSQFSAWYPANRPWTQPWLYELMTQWEWIDYSSPGPKFDRKVYSWIGAIPEGELNEEYWVSLTTHDTNGNLKTIRLQDGGPTESGERLMIVTRNEIQNEYLVSKKLLDAGKPPVTFMKNRDGSEISEEDQAFFRGVPKRRAYASSRIRYTGTGVRKDAFKAHIGYTYVDVPDVNGDKIRYQRDIWFSEEVPFGVFQFEDKATDVKSKSLLSRQLWKIDSAGTYLPRLSDSPVAK